MVRIFKDVDKQWLTRFEVLQSVRFKSSDAVPPKLIAFARYMGEF